MCNILFRFSLFILHFLSSLTIICSFCTSVGLFDICLFIYFHFVLILFLLSIDFLLRTCSRSVSHTQSSIIRIRVVELIISPFSVVFQVEVSLDQIASGSPLRLSYVLLVQVLGTGAILFVLILGEGPLGSLVGWSAFLFCKHFSCGSMSSLCRFPL